MKTFCISLFCLLTFHLSAANDSTTNVGNSNNEQATSGSAFSEFPKSGTEAVEKVKKGQHLLGLVFSNGGSISYQCKFSEKARLEVSLGATGFSFYNGDGDYWDWDDENWSRDYFGRMASSVLSVSFQATGFLGNPKYGFGWFAGPGIVLRANQKMMGIGICAQGGFRYKFPKIPLQLSLEYRPDFSLIIPKGYLQFHFGQVGVGVHYCF